MERQTKIAIYSGEIPSTTFIERLIKGLAEKGVSIYLFGTRKQNLPYQNQQIIDVSNSPKRLQKAWFLFYYSFLLTFFRNSEKRKLDQILKQQHRTDLYTKVKCYPVLWHKPDIFHVQWAKGLADWFWVKEFGIKLVLSLRGAHINYSPIANKRLSETYKNLFPEVDAFHAVSKAILKESQKYNAEEGKIKVVYSGIDLQKFQSGLKNNSNSTKTYNVISIGRPHWIKGYYYAIDAFKILKDQGFNFRYTIVGGSNLELEYQISELNLEKEIKIIDKIHFEAVQKKILASDLLLLPSLKEGIANVVLEAMALKTLVLSTACGGMEEVIEDGENGFLVPIRNPIAIAEKIKRISELSEVERLKITDHALQSVTNNHSEEKMIHGMLELYQSL